MTDDIRGLPVLVEAGVGYVLVVDGADVVGCLRHIAVNIRDDGSTWRPTPVVLEDGTTWSPLPPTRDPTEDRVAARYAVSLASTRVLKSPLAEAFGVEEHLTPALTLALAPAWAERVLGALAEGRTSVEIIDEWPDPLSVSMT